MDRDARRWVAGGGLLAVLPLLGYLNADGVAALVRARAGGGPLLAPASRMQRPRVAAFHATSAASILARNAFDSSRGPLDQPPAPGPLVIDADDAPVDPHDAPPCADVRVVAIAASEDPAFSVAALRTGEEAVLRRRGGEIGERRVAYVGWDRVWLEDDRGLCQAALFAPAPLPATTPTPAKAATPTPTPGPPAIAVRRKSATEVEVDRAAVEEILRDPTSLQKTVRVAIEKKNGDAVGLRLYGITPQSALGALGFENGDRLDAINGFDVARPEAALEAYARLREASHLEVKVDRGGRPTTLTIDVR